MNQRVLREAVAVGLLLGAVLLAVALLSHSPVDPSPLHASTLREQPNNLAGWFGATLSAALLGVVGISALILPLLFGVLGWRFLRERYLKDARATASGWALLFVVIPGFAYLVLPEIEIREGVVSGGGLVGRAVDELLGAFAGPAGRLVFLVFLLALGVLLVSGVSVARGVDGVGRLIGRWFGDRRRSRARGQRKREQERARRRVLERQLDRLEDEGALQGPVTVKEVQGRGRFRIVRKVVGGRELEQEEEDEDTAPPTPPRAGSSARRKTAKPRKKAEPKPRKDVVQEEFEFVEDLESYSLPNVSFLEPPDEVATRDSSALIEIAKRVTDKCQEFKVRGEVVNIRTGPVITTYEFRLDSGVKISAVQGLSEDLALALKTESVRIDRIPGRATVGIEVPNPNPEVIRIGQLVDSSEFQRSGSILTITLGVDIHGTPVFADLARMPHLLMGGFTGSGKSVGINAMILSILYRARPDQVKFIFVDPKMVELGVYADIPHLLTPIIIDPKKAANALGWAVDEMENRYRRLAALGVRNLEQFNQLVSDPVQLKRVREQLFAEDSEDNGSSFERLPYIVIVIDELADLMMTSSRAVEESITRLAQKARAVGVHLICATQRPSVDILTGIIKANFPSRIAYKVRSKFDSRTILDVMGAEHLLGRGDMLYLPPGTSNLRRLHGPLVTEKEIATVVRYIKRFGKPEYLREVISHPPLGPPDKGGGRRTTLEDGEELTDPMYDRAARMVVETRKASASYIQRRLHLGYTRSARLLDMMEKEGVVGPLNGSKGRDVLVSPDFFGEVDDTHALNPPDD